MKPAVYRCQVCGWPFQTPQGRGGHERSVHGIRGKDPHRNIGNREYAILKAGGMVRRPLDGA